VKATAFSKALTDLGQMVLIYGSDLLFIMIDGGVDYTGTSGATGGEIPGDIREMIKSTINAIGGNVYYVPNNPRFMVDMVQIGHTTYERKYSPHVLLTGGITEFDRGMDTRGKNEDFGLATNDDKAGIEYLHLKKESLANITLDFNLLDFHANVGIPQMQTVNSMRVHKGLAESELAVSLYGPTFGLKGTIKKVEGRHAAVRLLVQFSIIQMVGKYFDLPYWTLLDGVPPDPIVMNTLRSDFYGMNPLARMIKIKEYLFLNGYDVPINGELDHYTNLSLQHFFGQSEPYSFNSITAEMFIDLHCNVPLIPETMNRRILYNEHLEAFIRSLNEISEEEPPESSQDEPSEADTQDQPAETEAAESDDMADERQKAEPKAESDSLSRMLDLLNQKKRLPPPPGDSDPPDSSVTTDQDISPGDQW